MYMYRYTKEHGIEIGGYTYPVGQEDQGSATVCNQQGESRHCRLLPTSTMGAGMTKKIKNKKKSRRPHLLTCAMYVSWPSYSFSVFFFHSMADKTGDATDDIALKESKAKQVTQQVKQPSSKACGSTN